MSKIRLQEPREIDKNRGRTRRTPRQVPMRKMKLEAIFRMNQLLLIPILMFNKLLTSSSVKDKPRWPQADRVATLDLPPATRSQLLRKHMKNTMQQIENLRRSLLRGSLHMRNIIKEQCTGNRAGLASAEGPHTVGYRNSRRNISEEIGVSTQILSEPTTIMLGTQRSAPICLQAWASMAPSRSIIWPQGSLSRRRRVDKHSISPTWTR